MRITLSLLLITIILSGCTAAGNSTQTGNPITTKNSVTTPVDIEITAETTQSQTASTSESSRITTTTVESATPEATSASEPVTPAATSTSDLPDQPEYKKYTDFLGVNDTVDFFHREDIDLDSNQEVVIAFKNQIHIYDYAQCFVLREERNGLCLISKFGAGGYNVSSLEIIKMEGRSESFICAYLTNGANLRGFELYELAGNDLRKLVYSASATGAGDDYLIDTDNNGAYDGYFQYRYSYDVFYFNVRGYYTWDGSKFTFEKSEFNYFPEYPNDAREFIQMFLRLNLLKIYKAKCDEISVKLKEMNASDSELSFNDPDMWGEETLLFSFADFEIEENENTAQIVVTMQSESISFDMEKNNGHWQITKMSGSNVIDKN